MLSHAHPLVRARRLGLACVVLCLAALAPVAQADTVGRNVYTADGEVRPAQAIAGDLMAVGGRVVLEQPVGGDAALAAGAVDVRAPVEGDLRAVGGAISVNNRVGGDLVAAGGDIALRPAASVGGTADLRAAHIALAGRVDGSLRARGQKIRIDGEVRGPAEITAERIELGPGAKLLGPLTYASPSDLVRAEGAVVQGPVTRREAVSDGRAAHAAGARTEPGLRSGGVLLLYLALFAFAAAFVLLMPAFSGDAASALRRAPWASLGIGAAILAALPLMVVLLCITVLGIPLAMALLALYPVLLLAGFVVGVLALGRIAVGLRRTSPRVEDGSRLGVLAVALLLAVLLGLVPVLGPFALLLLALAGMGAGVLRLRERHRARHGKAVAQDELPLPGHDVFPA